MTGIDPLLVAGGAWLWDSYGKDALAWLVKRLGKQAEALKDAGWDKIDWARAARIYREELERQYGSMQIFGMNRPVPLGDIFTDVYLLDTPSAWRRHAIEELRGRAQLHSDDTDQAQRQDGVALVRAQPRLFILGQPGAGKTTFLKYLVMQAVQGKIDAIPIFVALKAWSDAKIDLMPFLVRQLAICHFPDAQPFIEYILEQGKAIVLFDGLDEVNLEGGTRERITSAVRDFARQYGRSHVVITCRTAATEYLFEQFRYCELADFTPAQIETFVARWFQHAAPKHAAFLTAFAQSDNQRLRELARRPLLLTLLCLTFDETMAFPRRRAELYEEAIDALLKKWDAARSIQRDTIYRKLSLGYKRQLLMQLAAETFEAGEFFMPKRSLVERIERFLRRLPPADSSEDIDGEAVLRSIEAQHGLLIERARGIYSFSHLTFHEYFTARYLAEHLLDEVLGSIVSHATDQRWREVLLLTSSMLDDRNAARLFDIWCLQLQQQIAADAELTALFRWVRRQAKDTGSLDRLNGWSTMLVFALLDYSVEYALRLTHHPDLARTPIRTHDLVRALDLARVLNLDLDFTHARARALNIDLDLARDLARARDRGRAHDLAHALDLARARARDLARDLARARILIGTTEHQPRDTDSQPVVMRPSKLRFFADWYSVLHCAEYIALGAPLLTTKEQQSTYAQLTSTLDHLRDQQQDIALVQELQTLLPQPMANSAAWSAFAATVRTRLIAQLDLAHRWDFSHAQLDLLDRYFASTERLLECLDLAAVEERDAILERLFTPPDAPAADGAGRRPG